MSRSKKGVTKRKKRTWDPFRDLINFKGRAETFGQIFGEGPMSFPEMQDKLWNFIKEKNLLRYKK